MRWANFVGFDDNAELWLRKHSNLVKFVIMALLLVVMGISAYVFITRIEYIRSNPCKVCWDAISPHLG